MKKVLFAGFLCAVAVTASALAFPQGAGLRAKAAEAETGEVAPDEADECLLDFVKNDVGNQIQYTRKPLYNEDLEQNGWQYDFTTFGYTGYALMTNIQLGDQSIYEIEELYYSGTSPFDSCRGMPVYIAGRTYIDCYEGNYYNLTDGSLLSEAQLQAAMSVRFSYNNTGTDSFYSYNQTITYDHKATTQEYTMPYKVPTYEGAATSSNCAVIAGSVVIGYYDRFCEDLVPDYQTYVKLGSAIIYRSVSTEIAAMQDSLYSLMGTGTNGGGTTFAGFQAGMKSYVNGQGYTYSSSDLFSWGSFNLSNYKTAVEAEKPVALFLSVHGYALQIETNSAGTQDTIYNYKSEVAHACVGCGYKVDTYYDSSNNVIAERQYLRVSTGLQSVGSIAYLNISESVTTIDHAISITIQ